MQWSQEVFCAQKAPFSVLISYKWQLNISPTYLGFVLSQGKKTLTNHRDMTRVQMPAKMFPHLKLLCWLFMGPTLGFDTKEINSFWSNLVFFTIKTRFWHYYSKLNMRKSHFNDEFGGYWAHNQQLFACSNGEKNKPKQQRVHALVLSLWGKQLLMLSPL